MILSSDEIASLTGVARIDRARPRPRGRERVEGRRRANDRVASTSTPRTRARIEVRI